MPRCPKCGGNGYLAEHLQDGVCDPFGCEVCDGTGKVTKKQLAKYETDKESTNAD